MTDALLAEQIAYYRRRATEYDASAYGDLAAARLRIDRLVAALPPAERTLELACGTGMWTQALARRATALTAVDASPEALAIAHGRCPSGVEFGCADVFDWSTDRRFDLIFFAFWLSHVPSARLADFFARLDRMLAPGGQIVFVDEHVRQAGKETMPDRQREIAERTLADGSTHRLVKVYLDPAELSARLRAMRWDADVTADGEDWVLGRCAYEASSARISS